MCRSGHLVVAALWQAAVGICFGQSLAPSNGAASLARFNDTLPQIRKSFGEWKRACASLPSNRALGDRLPAKELLPLQRFDEFGEILSAFFAQCKTGSLAQPDYWVDQGPRKDSFFNTSTAYFLKSAFSSIPFEPFAQKLVAPEGSEVFFHADLHGDIHSLLGDLDWLNERGYLRDFGIARTNFYMIFLGDYTDRGAYGVEVLYTLLRLKLANPDQVFLLRGNHEDAYMQARYGFVNEGRAKYGTHFDANKVMRAYDFFPVVLYLGSGGSFIQCHHGGLEAGFDPRRLLEGSGALSFQFLGVLNQARYLSEHPSWFAAAGERALEEAVLALRDFRPEDPTLPAPIGFMWNDFSLLASDRQFAVHPKRAFVFGQRATQYLLRTASTGSNHLQAVFRGHQHSPTNNAMMRRLLASRGVFRHWQSADSPELLNAPTSELARVLEHGDERAIPPGSVWTFNVSPDSVYGAACAYNFDAFGLLKIARRFADWRLQVVNVEVKP